MYTSKIKVGIIGISHTYESIIKALKQYNYTIIVCDIDKEKLSKIPYEKYTDYRNLLGKIDIAFIATPPSTHYEIILFFLKNNIKVICEKPLVTKIEELDEITKYDNLYNVLHFSHGEEIDWFINNYKKELPERIICTINDPYIEENKIKKEKLSLHGSYLDEAINPLSAINKIFRKKIKFINNKKYFYKNDKYDFKSESNFKINNTLITIKTNWNDYENKEKYIDLIYKDKTIRLDSINVKVIDLTNNIELYKSKNIRMDMHYINGLKNIDNNKDIYYELNKVILEGEEHAENYFY